MKPDNKAGGPWLYALGLVPVIWFALLIAPAISGGLSEIVSALPAAMNNPFKIVWCEDSVKSRHRQSLAPVIAAIVFSRLHKAMFKNIFHDLPIRLWFIPPSVQVHQLGRLSSNDKAVIPLTPQI